MADHLGQMIHHVVRLDDEFAMIGLEMIGDAPGEWKLAVSLFAETDRKRTNGVAAVPGH